MGSCNSRECGEPDLQTSSTYHPTLEAHGGTCTPLTSGDERSDGAVENRAVHEGAILGIASAGIGEFVTCGEDKALRLHSLDGESGSFRESLSFIGHAKAVSRATYGATTRLFYSCSRDTTIRQWNRSGSSALRVFEGHDMACAALALSADERTLSSGSRDTSVRTWDVQTGQCTASAKTPRNLVTCLKYLCAESSASVVQGGEDLRLRVWDVREAGLRPSLTVEGYTFFPLCLDVSACGHEVLTSCKGFGGAGCETKLWDLRNTRMPVREYTGHVQDTTACVFLDMPQRIVSDVSRRDGREGEGSDGRCDAPACACHRMIATASKDGTIKIYDRDSGDIVVDHAELGCGGYTGLAFHHDPSTGLPILYASTITDRKSVV